MRLHDAGNSNSLIRDLFIGILDDANELVGVKRRESASRFGQGLANLFVANASDPLANRRQRRRAQLIEQVAKLFAGIFVTITPAIAMLQAGSDGVMAPLVALMSGAGGAPNNALYFWMTGALSSFLDNAPTYLVFFNLAGGDAAALTGPLATTLVAISAGAVFMGANTYIGNAPNFMVKSIAESRGVRMPSFFGYLGWSLLVLVPVYVLLTLIFFR